MPLEILQARDDDGHATYGRSPVVKLADDHRISSGGSVSMNVDHDVHPVYTLVFKLPEHMVHASHLRPRSPSRPIATHLSG